MGRLIRYMALLGIMTIAMAGRAFATTYYVAANGSDSNNGTSESTPWAHLPGMRNWTGSYTPTAGDVFILRGCDVWGNASFPVNWAWGGSSGNHIVVSGTGPGTSYTAWYNSSSCPSGWNRPIFDAGQAIMGGGAECSVNNMFLNISGITYVDFGWLELRNYYNNSGSCPSKDRWVNLQNPADYITFNNFYVHASITGPSSTDNDSMWGVSSLGMCLHCAVTYSVIDNSDGTQYTSGGIQFSLQHSVCQYVSNCSKVTSGGEIAYNDYEHIGTVISGVHANCIETVANYTQTFWIHDNRIHNMDLANELCESLQIGNTGETDYVWNNLLYDLGGANGPDIPQACNTGVAALYMFNNTFVVTGRAAAVSFSGCAGTNWTTAFVMSNNHCIQGSATGGSSQSQYCLLGGTVSGATTISFQDNLSMTSSTATSDGYTGTQTYVYSPTLGTSPTVGAGQNLTSTYWPAGFTTNDTSYACSEQTVSGVVQSVCPGRTSNTRPPSGAWNVGSYEFASASSQPAAPSGLTAVVQ
ncbi:MAG TPA: hypothetical protein VMU43_14380 [Candidatus Acidoferrum sp.]|nr:hypothetical protein [Candidatus Acidoferrum sp.]